MTEKIYVGTKRIGSFNKEKKLFYKTISKPDHIMIKNNAYGFDKYWLERLAEKDYKIMLRDKVNNKRLNIKAADWLNNGFTEDYGHRPQVFIQMI